MLGAFDLIDGQPVARSKVNESNPHAVQSYLCPVIYRLRETLPNEWLWVFDEIYASA